MGLQSSRFLPQHKNSHDSKYGVDMTEVSDLLWWTSNSQVRATELMLIKDCSIVTHPPSFYPKNDDNTTFNTILFRLVSKVRGVWVSWQISVNPLKTYRMANAVSQDVFPKISKGKIEPLRTKLPLRLILILFDQTLDHVLVRFGGL